jgi:hypothetical protein
VSISRVFDPTATEISLPWPPSHNKNNEGIVFSFGFGDIHNNSTEPKGVWTLYDDLICKMKADCCPPGLTRYGFTLIYNFGTIYFGATGGRRAYGRLHVHGALVEIL